MNIKKIKIDCVFVLFSLGTSALLFNNVYKLPLFLVGDASDTHMRRIAKKGHWKKY